MKFASVALLATDSVGFDAVAELVFLVEVSEG